MQVAQHLRHLFFAGKGAEPLVFQLQRHELRRGGQLRRPREIHILRQRRAQVCRAFEKGQLVSRGDGVERLVDVAGDGVQGVFFGAEIQKRVFEGQIEQAALPLFVARHLCIHRQRFARSDVGGGGGEVGIFLAQELRPALPLHFEGQRADARQAAAADVDDGVVALFGAFAGKVLFGGGVIGVFAGEGVFHVEHGDVVDALGDILRQQGDIVACAVGKAVVVQPHAAGDALFAQRQYGMQAGAFKAGGKKQRHLQRGGALFFEQFARPRHGNGFGIVARVARFGNGCLFDCGKDRRRHLAELVLIPFGIAVPLAGDLPLFQLCARLFEDAQAVGKAGADKTRQLLDAAAAAAPHV